MWVFNYTIKCTIRHNYQCSEPETAHNRRVIYCSLCLHYSARSLMLPGCLHTALLPWRQARYHHAGLTNGVLVLDPWIVSEVSAASPGVEGPARCSLPSDIRCWFELASEPPGRAGGRSVILPSPCPRVLKAGAGWPRCCERSEVIKPQSGHRLDEELPHGPGSAVHGLHDFRELRRAPGLSFPMCKTSNREDLRSVSKHCLMSQLLYL